MQGKILVVNGPNLNLLGEREPEVYGAQTLSELNRWLSDQVSEVDLAFFQSNHEGAIIDYLHEHRHSSNGLVTNPGGLTHYSVALRDAIVGCQLVAVEVHISDIHNREAFRRVSMIKDVCIEQISGQGSAGYLTAIKLLIKHLTETQ
jgi:3-dehydroquinate dehydratase-2